MTNYTDVYNEILRNILYVRTIQAIKTFMYYAVDKENRKQIENLLSDIIEFDVPSYVKALELSKFPDCEKLVKELPNCLYNAFDTGCSSIWSILFKSHNKEKLQKLKKYINPEKISLAREKALKECNSFSNVVKSLGNLIQHSKNITEKLEDLLYAYKRAIELKEYPDCGNMAATLLLHIFMLDGLYRVAKLAQEGKITNETISGVYDMLDHYLENQEVILYLSDLYNDSIVDLVGQFSRNLFRCINQLSLDEENPKYCRKVLTDLNRIKLNLSSNQTVRSLFDKLENAIENIITTLASIYTNRTEEVYFSRNNKQHIYDYATIIGTCQKNLDPIAKEIDNQLQKVLNQFTREEIEKFNLFSAEYRLARAKIASTALFIINLILYIIYTILLAKTTNKPVLKLLLNPIAVIKNAIDDSRKFITSLKPIRDFKKRARLIFGLLLIFHGIVFAIAIGVLVYYWILTKFLIKRRFKQAMSKLNI